MSSFVQHPNKANTNLTILLGEKLLLRVFSFLDFTNLFFARMVCSRWRRICERPEIYVYANLTMKDFITHNKHLPLTVVNTFVESLALSGDEIEAIKACCRVIPSDNSPSSVAPPLIPTDFPSTTANFPSTTTNSPSTTTNSPSTTTNSTPNSSLPSTPTQERSHIPISSETPSSLSPSKSEPTPLRASKEQEKELARREKLRKEKDRRHTELKKMWIEDIVPNWDKRKGTKRLKEAVWQGIPSSVRTNVWPKLIGNELRITPELFEIFGARAARAKQQAEGASLGREGTVQLISLDLPRTFPALSIFQQGGPCHSQLASVLEAWTCYRPDVGYVQGMSYLAAVFLLNLDEYHGFICLANLLNNPCYMSFFNMNMVEIRKYMDAMDFVMAKEVPKVHKRLKELGITSEIFMIDWVLTLYSKSLPLDVASRVWDTTFLEGEVFVFQTALGILRLYGSVLETAPFDTCMTLLTHLPQELDDDELFQNIAAIKLTTEVWKKLVGYDNRI